MAVGIESTRVADDLLLERLDPPGVPRSLHVLADVERELAQVRATHLSPLIVGLIERYREFGRRPAYLWQWCRYGVAITSLPCVADALRDDLCDTKVLSIVLDVLLDDLADQNGSEPLLEHLLALPLAARAEPPPLPPEQRAYARFTAEVWDEVWARAERYPCFEVYAALLRYDYLQLFNTMRYAHLLNRNPALLNGLEHDLYLPPNMHMMISATLDLMCSPRFHADELGRLREVVWHAQCMGWIGNLCTTWERELAEGDYTSGVYARAVSLGDLTPADLREGDRGHIRAAIRHGQHEAHFLRRWYAHREAMLAQRPRLRSFDVAELVEGLDRLLCSQLGSRGAM
jgi:hypothetical protein